MLAFGEYVSLSCFNSISLYKLRQIFVHFAALNESEVRCTLLPVTVALII